MKSTIVIYYSNKGSNKYLAEKISKRLSCDIEEIKPRVNVLMLFFMNIQLGIKPIKSNISEYDRVILCGPVYVGRLLAPLKSFIKKYKSQINKLVFVSCCGSSEEKKYEKFGHGLVFNQVEELLAQKSEFCQAFPMDLIVAEDLKEDPEAIMKTRLSDSTFKGEIENKFKDFILKLS